MGKGKKKHGKEKDHGSKGKDPGRNDPPAGPGASAWSDYGDELRRLQIELVRFQRHLIESGGRVLVILEGRDAAGKDGTIKRLVEHMAPRETRVVALSKPTERERGSWYFQRYVPHLPAASEFVVFNRSWYNRAGVEPVMGFCTQDEHERFLEEVPFFETMLVHDGIQLFKYYLDIDRDVQRERLEEREEDPLKHWKQSPIDAAALGKWDDYSRYRNSMLGRTHGPLRPWTIVRANDKHRARIELIRDLLSRLDYPEKDEDLLVPDRDTVFLFDESLIGRGWISE